MVYLPEALFDPKINSTQALQDLFIKAYEKTGNITKCVQFSGISPAVLQGWLDDKDNRTFSGAFNAAKLAYLNKLEAVADLRAIKGVRSPVYYKGAVVGHVWKPSDELLMFRLKRLDPAYRDASQINITQHSVDVKRIEVRLAGVAPEQERIIASQQQAIEQPKESEIPQSKNLTVIEKPVDIPPPTLNEGEGE